MPQTESISFRRGTLDDSHAVFEVFVAAMADFGRRTGTEAITGGSDPAVIAELWARRRSLFAHLAGAADQFWVAARGGEIIGYARAIRHESLRALTEFFVLPAEQSAGVGHGLLARALPAGEDNRVVVATTDTRALSRYLKAGLTARFPVCHLSRKPEAITLQATDLAIVQADETPDTLEQMAKVDMAVLGVRRDADHAWLLRDRRCYLYTRNGRVYGYGYVGYRSGPFALLDAHDYPAVLAHAETSAAVSGYAYFGVELPTINRVAMQYLLSRRFRLDPFHTFFLSDRPFGQFEQYALTSPPFFI